MVLKESQISVEHFVSGFVDYTYLPGEDHQKCIPIRGGKLHRVPEAAGCC